MILLIDLTEKGIPLLYDEFVLPVKKIINDLDLVNYVIHLSSLTIIPDDVSHIIICGTALADLNYSMPLSSHFLSECKKPILGICAGMQILMQIDGGEVIQSLEIGMIDLVITREGRDDPLISNKDVMSVYSLHQKSVDIPSSWKVLATTTDELKKPEIVRSRVYPRYGVLFHPEVRNEWLIERFVRMKSDM